MSKGKLNTKAVIATAILSLLGLGWVQYNWLQDSIQANEQLFHQKIDLASGMVNEALDKDHLIHQLISRDLSGKQELSDSTEEVLTSFIDSVIYHHTGLRTRYEYGLYSHAAPDESNIFVRTAGEGVPEELSFINCLSDQELDFGWLSLNCRKRTCSHGQPSFHYHLALFFSDNHLFLISEMKGTLLAAFFFISLLSVCFIYAIITIRRQKRLSAMKNDFINNLTHEFKTPIFSIDLAASILNKSPSLAEDQKLKSYTDIISSESERLKNQVDKVLQMALVDSNNFKLEKKLLNVHDLIHKVVESFDILIKQRSGRIKLNLQASNSHLFADETHLKNIIYNLLDNAQKYSPQKPDITITTRDGEEGLILQIEDHGIGMSEQTQKYVFDKFYRENTSDVHDVKGFGLGLSYVKSVVDAHNATINLMSTLHKGSTFTLQFKA